MSITASAANAINDLLEKMGLNTGPLIGELIVSAIVFAVAVVIGWFVYLVFEKYLTRWAERTKTKLDDEILRNVKKPIYLVVVLFGIYHALNFLTILRDYSVLLTQVFTVIEILVVTFIVTRVVNVLVVWYAEKSRKRGKELSDHLLFILKKIVQVFIYLIAFLIILSAFNIDLTGVAVGLGVGGIAIALALQNILNDVFSAFSIYFDRPFEIGDFIIVGSYAGTVKKIGIKSTRIELLQGEELVMSNRELTTASIRNFKKMKKRRISFSIGVTYDTSLEKLKKIPDIIKNVIDPKKLPDVDRLDRVHFKEFGPYSLNFEIVYYMKTRDYLKYMDAQQAINFAIKEAFEKEGIEMAFPTQTVFLNRES
ncbi:MAG: mechanosensitive ion channel family protein [Thermoplasmata archaeon]|nr:MAG: mechanosensitive ion channel family protein [Thermoplasmata archaeon]